ncbi:Holliday junction branch migration protein RuvA [Flavobacteriales bacterium]|jgi:Holliday junction DNA helicase RuvA|nr:Holliday junction branch migration protein RuvA [Flavobacteriales bacterium]
MITHVQGKLVELNPAYAVIDCNGVGYLLHISLNTYSKLGDSEFCKLFSHLAIKEDSHTLYGFHEELERKVFRLLISVSGVGASTARVILSSMLPEEIRDAIVNEDVALIKSVKGIGAKTAQRIILDLKDKMLKAFDDIEMSVKTGNRNREEALSALEVLGFPMKAVHKLIDKLLEKDPQIGVEELVKQALKQL